MYVFKRIGLHAIRFLNAIFLFFSFIGHLSYCSKDVFLGRVSLTTKNIIRIIHFSGVSLSLPLLIISALMGMSFGINSYLIFTKFHIQDKALSIVQTLLVQDVLPLLIGFVLCVQVSLNMINARIKITKLQRTSDEVILEYILPIIIGINIAGILLYIYLMAVVSLSLYLTFYHLLNSDLQIFLLETSRTTTLSTVTFSLFKTFLYCSIVSFTAGYYYYQVSTHHILPRRAVSRILTRGSLWLTVSSVSIKLLNL